MAFRYLVKLDNTAEVNDGGQAGIQVQLDHAPNGIPEFIIVDEDQIDILEPKLSGTLTSDVEEGLDSGDLKL